PSDHAQRAVEPATPGNRVEVRARPDVRQLGPAPTQPAEEIPSRVGGHLEPGLPHPAGDELVRLVLLGAPTEPVRAGPAADGTELVEPLEHAHGHTLGPQRAEVLD